MASRALCPVCSLSVRFRRNGTLGAHKVTIYDGWEQPYRSIIGTVQCSGTGLRPGDPPVPQTCGWCEKTEPCRCSGRHST